MWTIEPGRSVGPLRLGMNETEYTEVLGSPNAEFKRTAECSDVILAFDHACVHLATDRDGCVSQISVFQPKEVTLRGVQLLGRNIDTAADELRATGLHLRSIDAGLWSEEAGIVLVEVERLIDGVEVGPITVGPAGPDSG